MYKLILGNTKINVTDEIDRKDAISAAKQAISEAGEQGKLLSQIDIYLEEQEIKVSTVERTGSRTSRKTIKQSMLDAIVISAQEKLYPSGDFTDKDLWFDIDTGQEWYGNDIEIARTDIIEKLKEWIKTV